MNIHQVCSNGEPVSTLQHRPKSTPRNSWEASMPVSPGPMVQGPGWALGIWARTVFENG